MPSTRTVEQTRKVTSSYPETPTYLQVVSHGVAQQVALSTGEMTSPGGLGLKEVGRLLRLQRRLARAARGPTAATR